MSYKAQFKPNEHLMNGRWVSEPAPPADKPPAA